jgi:hypothetical protein
MVQVHGAKILHAAFQQDVSRAAKPHDGQVDQVFSDLH